MHFRHVPLILYYGALSSFAAIFPGPHVVSNSPAGAVSPEQWVAEPQAGSGVITYPVRDFSQPIIPVQGGPNGMNPPSRPTLVYNCYYLRALCENVNNFATAKGWTFPRLLHYDRDFKLTSGKGSRSTTRRGTSCPSTWIDQTRANGGNWCPIHVPTDYYMKGQTAIQSGYMYMSPNPKNLLQLIAHKNQFGVRTGKRDSNGLDKYRFVGMMLTCDEWPAASWVEGGGTGNDAASTICAPQNSACMGMSGGVATEQNWQGAAHGFLATWFRRMTPQAGANNPLWTIFKFEFRMETTANAPAAWLEVNRVRRYCIGPKGGTRAYRNAALPAVDCTP